MSDELLQKKREKFKKRYIATCDESLFLLKNKVKRYGG